MIFNGIKKEYLSVSNEFTLPARSEIDYISHSRIKTGIRIKRSRLKELYIVVPVTVHSYIISIDDLKVDVNNWLSHEENKKLIFDFSPDFYYMAKLSSIEWRDVTDTLMKGIIEFVCETPFRLGADKTLNIGTSFYTYTITGQTETPWTSRTRFSVPQSSYTLETNKGGKVILNYDFIAGDVLEIDYDKRDVWLNGKDLAVAIALETVWFELEPGAVHIRASHPTELMYSERYY